MPVGDDNRPAEGRIDWRTPGDPVPPNVARKFRRAKLKVGCGMEEVGDDQVSEPTGEPSTKPDDDADRSPSTPEARLERLLRTLVWVGDRVVAPTLRSLSDSDLKEQSAVIRTAVHALRRKQNPTAFLAQPQYRSAVPLVADAVSQDCQDAVVSALGDAADDPDRLQVLAALEEVGDRFPVSVVALALAYVAVTDMPAADVCDEILESEARYEVPVSAPPPG